MTQTAEVPMDEAAEKIRLRLWLKLLKMSRQIEGSLRENLRSEFSTTLPRFDVMAALYRFPKGLRMNELSAELKVSNGNVTGIVDRLVNDSIVVRIAVPDDRRALIVKLTPTGKKEFLQQAAAHEGWVDNLLSDLSIEDAEMMLSIADKTRLKPADEHTDS